MIKYIFISPFIGYIIIRDTATLLAHKDLLHGLELFLLTSLLIIALCLLRNLIVENIKVRKQIGNDVYEWMVR